MRRFWLGTLCLVIAGCKTDDLTGAGSPPPTAKHLAANVGATHRAQPHTMDDDFGAFVAELPGFGGLYLQGASETSPGDVVVWLTNPGAVPEVAVRARVSKLLERLGRDDLRDHVTAHGVTVVRGRYDFAQLQRWYPGATSLLSGAAVTRTDIDERRNRISVGIADESQREVVASALVRAGLPREALVIEVSPRAHLDARLMDPVRPVVGGVEISDDVGTNRCTLGFNWHTDQRYFITAAHCTGGPDAIGSVSGIVQNQSRYSYLSSNAIGYEAIDYPLQNNTVYSLCPADSPRGCRYSDAAAFRYYDGVADERNASPDWLANVGTGNDSTATIIGYHQTYGLKGSLLVGDAVSKVGATTGFSNGSVTATCSDQSPGDQYGYYGYTMLCQNESKYRATYGDSGAPVYYKTSDGKRYIAGLHWGSISDPANFPNGAISLFSSAMDVKYELFGCYVCTPKP